MEILIFTVSISGLAYHFIMITRPGITSLWQRIFPFIYWPLVAIAIARAVAIIDKFVNNGMITISIAIVGMTVGVILGRFIVDIFLHGRMRKIAEDAYHAVEEDRLERRRSPHE